MMKWLVHLQGGPELIKNALVVVDDYIYSFGGDRTGILNNPDSPIVVHLFNTNTFRWLEVPPPRDTNGALVVHPDMPRQLFGHSVVEYNKKIYLWGGCNAIVLFNALYCCDPKTLTWTRPTVSGSLPVARKGHSACVYGDYMYVLGGDNDIGRSVGTEVHSLNLKTFEWRAVRTTGELQASTEFLSAVIIKERLYVHSVLNYGFQFVYLDLRTNEWHQPVTTGPSPWGQFDRLMFTYNERIYIYGTYHAVLREGSDDFVEFNTVTNHWKLLQPNGCNPRSLLLETAIVKDTRLFAFGLSSLINESDGNEIYADIHIMDFSPTLKSLAINAISRYELDVSSLPSSLRHDINVTIFPNRVASLW